MTQQQAIQALNALTVKGIDYKISKINTAYITAKAAIENPGIPQVCGKNTGTGRFASSNSWQERTGNLLNRIGIGDIRYKTNGCVGNAWYEKTNVAPRGGAHGDRITVYFG